jgi:hypothetical protein
MSSGAVEPAARSNLEELYRRAIKLPLKWIGHAIEDWVANQSPMGNSSIIDADAFEWVKRLEKNSGLIKQEVIACFLDKRICPIFKNYPRGR